MRFMTQRWGNAWAVGVGVGRWEFWMELSRKIYRCVHGDENEQCARHYGYEKTKSGHHE